MKNFIGYRDRIGENKKAMEALLKVKGLSALKGDLQKVFNTFIRLRDTETGGLHGTKYFVCISCGQSKGLEEMHASHYWPAGGHEAVRFDEDNVHGACRHCNYFKHGNEKGYRPRLIKKIGQKAFDILELRAHNKSKLFRFEIELLIQTYKEKINLMKK